MPIDPICGMETTASPPFSLEKSGQRYYFCSQKCFEKFARANSLALNELPSCGIRLPWFKNKLILVLAALAIGVGLSFVIPSMIHFRHMLLMYVKTIWWAVLLGLVIGGMTDYYLPGKYFTRVLASSCKRTIFYSVGLGFLMSACCHGVLAIAIQLHKKGASTPSVIAFILASPWANLPLTFVLIGFFGITKSLYIIFVALAIALTTGFIYQVLESRGWVERNLNTVAVDESFSVRADILRRIQAYRFSRQQFLLDVQGIYRGAITLSQTVLFWIMFGIGLASLFACFIPTHLFRQYMGPTFFGMLVTLALATVVEVCSEGSVPLAFEIFRQTGALGNSLAFLMTGVATNYTAIGLLWQNVGRKAALWMPVITVPQIILYGLLANRLF